jgi:hypothetical protein
VANVTATFTWDAVPAVGSDTPSYRIVGVEGTDFNDPNAVQVFDDQVTTPGYTLSLPAEVPLTMQVAVKTKSSVGVEFDSPFSAPVTVEITRDAFGAPTNLAFTLS